MREAVARFFERDAARRRQLVGAETRRRIRLRQWAEADASHTAAAREACRRDPAMFIGDWLWTYDPRMPALGLPARLPFKLRPTQRRLVKWLSGREATQTSGLIEKSRDEGMTFVVLAFLLHHWTFVPGFAGAVGSRKQDLVDALGDPKALFPKLRYMLYSLPAWMRPKGFSRGEHDNFLRLTNPATGATITGEGGDNMGRGGRAQPLASRVLTPGGWTTMGDLSVGDLVVGSDGTPTPVVAVHEQGERDVYRVKFSDGSSTLCCAEHLWQVTDRSCRKVIARRGNRTYGVRSKVLSTAEIAQTLMVPRADDQQEFQYRVPLCKPVQFAPVDLPLHPYLLGSLLGDGSLGHIDRAPAGFTTADPESVKTLSGMLPDGIEIKHRGGYNYDLVDPVGRRGRGHINAIKKPLYDLGLAGTTSATKFIPEVYKRGGAEERVELLRGLFDTDGWAAIRRSGKAAPKACFTSVSSVMAADVVEVIQSLGGTAVLTTRPAARRKFPDGQWRECQPSFTVTANMPPGMCPFRLSRKASLYRERTKYKPSRSIVAVEPAGREMTRCITVGGAESLYLTDDFLVTHNCSMYFVDEWAFVDHAEAVNAAISQNSNVRIKGTTPNGPGNKAYEERFGGKLSVFSMHWKDNPAKNECVSAVNEQGEIVEIYPWYEKQKDELDEADLAQEVDIDWTASVKGVVIPAKWVRAAVGFEVPEGSVRRSGYDVAEAGGDDCVYVHRRGALVARVEAWEGTDTTTSTHRARELANADGAELLFYDRVGVGAGATGTLTTTEQPVNFKPVGINNGSRPTSTRYDDEPDVPATERFAGYGAELWWRLRRRFQKTYEVAGGIAEHPLDECIALPPGHASLVAQLSQPTYRKTEAGKVKVDKYGQGSSSPDEAEALMYAFAEDRNPAEDWSSAEGYYG